MKCRPRRAQAGQSRSRSCIRGRRSRKPPSRKASRIRLAGKPNVRPSTCAARGTLSGSRADRWRAEMPSSADTSQADKAFAAASLAAHAQADSYGARRWGANFGKATTLTPPGGTMSTGRRIGGALNVPAHTHCARPLVPRPHSHNAARRCSSGARSIESRAQWPRPRAKIFHRDFDCAGQAGMLVGLGKGIPHKVGAHFQAHARFESEGIVIARETPVAADRVRVLVVAPEAGRGVDRAADAAKAQGLHHEALDDVRVAGFLKTRPLLA